MSDQTITEASAALGRLAQFGRALADAEKVITGLAVAEQVGRELDAANEAKRAETEQLVAALSAAQDDLANAKAATDGEIATAKARAKSIADAADKKAAGIVADANEKATAAEDRAQKWAEQEVEAKLEVEKAQVDLAALQHRISDLTGKIAKVETAQAEAAEALES